MEAAADAPRVETPPRHTPPPTPTSAEGSEAGERPDEQQGDSPGDADVRPRSTVAHDFGGDTAGSALASPSPQAAPQERSGAFQDPLFLCEERHDASEAVTSLVALQDTLISKWRMKDRVRHPTRPLALFPPPPPFPRAHAVAGAPRRGTALRGRAAAPSARVAPCGFSAPDSIATRPSSRRR